MLTAEGQIDGSRGQETESQFTTQIGNTANELKREVRSNGGSSSRLPMDFSGVQYDPSAEEGCPAGRMLPSITRRIQP
jgi:hypothetical protein